jgi:malonyl-CoA O-methyltransferase
MSSAPYPVLTSDYTVNPGLTRYPFQPRDSQCRQQIQGPVVLVHGWGADSQIWRDLPAKLSRYGDIYTLDLPGFGASAALDWYSEQKLLEWLDLQLPDSCYLIGLSLGGMLCRAYAAQNPHRVRGLITLSTNLRFVASEQYPEAMAPTEFQQFSHSWQTNPDACLKRFKSLQAQGDQQQRQLMTELHHLVCKVDHSGASDLLSLLATLEGREHIQKIQCPSLAIFGAEDRLVPVEAATALPASHSKVIIAKASHLPHLSASSAVFTEIIGFLGVQDTVSQKRQLAESFSAAAASYDNAAAVQHWSGQQLINRIHNTTSVDSIVDLGCGTGIHCAQLKELCPQASVLGIDLASGMLKHAQSQFSDRSLNWLCGDAENLSLRGQSQAMVFSNFALQWCENLQQTSAEIYRVLKKGGCFYFAVPGPRSLQELRAAWSEVDSQPRINEFFSIDLWQDSLRSCGFTSVNLEAIEKIQYFPSVKHLMRNIQAVGANVKRAGVSQFTGKSQFQQLYSEYEKHRTENGVVPATWDIIFGTAVK